MARKKAKEVDKAKQPGGSPVCIAALYCDSAIIGEDKMVTIVRTIDTITFPAEAKFEVGDPIELTAPHRLVLMLKRGDATGLHEMPIIQTGPSGEKDTIGVIVQEFSDDVGPVTGYNFIGPIRFVWRGEGLYWLDVLSGTKKALAKTVLRLVFGPKKGKE